MLEEEMAVNWIRSQGWSEENLPSDEFGQMSQAFLAGLKAGKDMNVPTKWHDLRKNPNDLPRDYEIVLNQDGNETTYTSKRGFLGFGGIGLIAWCEKPKFEEK